MNVPRAMHTAHVVFRGCVLVLPLFLLATAFHLTSSQEAPASTPSLQHVLLWLEPSLERAEAWRPRLIHPQPYARVAVAQDIRVEPQVELLAKPQLLKSDMQRYQPQGPTPLPRLTLRATGYNSLVEQTNSMPFITATGARTRVGIIAVSRDLLPEEIPYGSLVYIHDLGRYLDGEGSGDYQAMLERNGPYIVEDTMHRRKRRQIDIWFEELHEARTWGVRRVEIEIVRYGRNGVALEHLQAASSLGVIPQFRMASSTTR